MICLHIGNVDVSVGTVPRLSYGNACQGLSFFYGFNFVNFIVMLIDMFHKLTQTCQLEIVAQVKCLLKCSSLLCFISIYIYIYIGYIFVM